jgi:putative toxin-antitoxin system antitoxin component (TIGR02293 family)
MTTSGRAVNRVLKDGMMDTADVAKVVRATQRSVQRWQAGVVPRKEAEDRLLQLAKVLEVARQTMTPSGVRLWLRAPNEALDWRQPLDVIRDGSFRQVIDALQAIAEGVIH